MSWLSTGSVRKISCLATIAIACLLSAQTQAQPPGGFGRGGGGGPGGPGGGMFGGGGPIQLIQRPDVQQELELLDDQKAQLKALGDKVRDRMGEMFGRQRGGGDQGNRDELVGNLRKFNEEIQADVDKILLPHQSKRLKQLEVQQRMRGGGVMGALGGDVAEQLGISEEQQDKLREKAQGLDQEMRKKMTEIRKQLQDQLLAELSPDQRKQFNDLVGEPFEFRDEDRPPPGGRGEVGRGAGGRDQGKGGTDRRRRPDQQK